MLACQRYERNEREQLLPLEQPIQKPVVALPKGNGLLFRQIRLKVANLREAEAAGLVKVGTADKFLDQVQAIVQKHRQ